MVEHEKTLNLVGVNTYLNKKIQQQLFKLTSNKLLQRIKRLKIKTETYVRGKKNML